MRIEEKDVLRQPQVEWNNGRKMVVVNKKIKPIRELRKEWCQFM